MVAAVEVEAAVVVAAVVVVVAAAAVVVDPVVRVDRVVAAAGAATVALTAMPHRRRSMIPCAVAGSPSPPRWLATSVARRGWRASWTSLRGRLSASTVQNRWTPHRPWH
jgi:hypothetical protein